MGSGNEPTEGARKMDPEEREHPVPRLTSHAHEEDNDAE